jgi:hypothetical protein
MRCVPMAVLPWTGSLGLVACGDGRTESPKPAGAHAPWQEPDAMAGLFLFYDPDGKPDR